MKPAGLLFKILLSLGTTTIAVGTLMWLLVPEQDHISFLSEESRTLKGEPVANSVSLTVRKNEDIWIMNQSHDGPHAPAEKWDRIAIVVNRTTKEAKFYQLESGQLTWSDQIPETNFKVSCGVCHSNGPRAIRPQSDLEGHALDLKNVFQIWKWNVRIKAYSLTGPLHEKANNQVQGKARTIPLHLPGKYANDKLTVGVCILCHRDSGPLAHGTLTRQNATAIKHMVDAGHMPPLGFPLPQSQRLQLQKFLSGI